jgi:hypothetical protein
MRLVPPPQMCGGRGVGASRVDSVPSRSRPEGRRNRIGAAAQGSRAIGSLRTHVELMVEWR